MDAKKQDSSSRRGAYFVALGILLSRLAGLVRVSVLAHFLGDSDAADAFYAALKIPNFPQNLFGEGVLSASFIPVYANLIGRGDDEQAGKVAGAIFSLLCVVISVIVLGGILLTPTMIDVIAPGFTGEKRELTIRLVQIIFPGTGLLVLSAWCLGILNSHHRFFLSYAAPVIWNAAIVGVLFLGRGTVDSTELVVRASWGLVLGSFLQFAVQFPTAWRLIQRLRLGFFWQLASVREVVRNFVPVVIGRGVVQLSAYVDNILASFLPTGAVSALGYAQTIYMLPISLFGMSVSAAELPAMSQAYGTDGMHEKLRVRLTSAMRRIAFLVIPSMVGFLLLGDAIVGLLYQSGRFTADTSIYVWGVLAGSAVGLMASTLGRLYASAFYSLRDTRTPLYFSIIRVILTTVLGYLFGLRVPVWCGVPLSWGTAGLTASAGFAGWVEFLALRSSLHKKIGVAELKAGFVLRVWLAAGLCGALSFALKVVIPPTMPMVRGVAVLSLFVWLYFPLTAWFGIEESRQLWFKIRQKLSRRR